ncbi:hypothetical protein PHMEG_0003785 [Phytophthora megakarya]|uniref:Uncharacterized protein n=1 Tax=Phytophthora megakarya TaxID=4795 RepID=A0A225WXR1_9STRA|nr:hypothetical protein PHMEG_0003785 [Phytophthora megakarya]
MDFEHSASVDGGSKSDDLDACDEIHDSDEEECGLADAFMQFEAQAEKRTLGLLKATDEQLFLVPQRPTESNIEEEGNVPAYVYMSDQFRLKKPPQFQHWQQNFQYLQVAGSRMLGEESMEHIQLVSMENTEKGSVNGDVDDIVLRVKGRTCLRESTAEWPDSYEEIILCDGLMEETLEHQEDAGDTLELKSGIGKISPRSAHVEEVLDALTMECFSSTVAPMLTSFYFSSTVAPMDMLEKQQYIVKTAREEKEAASNRTIQEQVAFEKARQLQMAQEAREEAARIEALELQRQEEERKETERRELLLKQQLEENDEEEVKIKTLAYSHMREWYQPNKKCFSHRGRQLTYLKPVLQTKVYDVWSLKTFR